MNAPPRKRKSARAATKLVTEDETAQYEQVGSSGSEAGGGPLTYSDNHFSSDMKDTQTTTLSSQRERTGSDYSNDTLTSQTSEGQSFFSNWTGKAVFFLNWRKNAVSEREGMTLF